jgi:hypothetical protein
MSGLYGRQECPDLPEADLRRYLEIFETPPRSECDGNVQHTETRLRMLALMLSRPEEEWTAAKLVEALDGEPAPTSVVRDTFYLLMHDRSAEPVPFQRALTVRLTPAGLRILGATVARWRATSAAEDRVTEP